MTGEDLRDWPNVTLAEARDAADALGWTAEVERRVALDRLDAMRGHPPPAASLDDYARTVIDAMAGLQDPVIVSQSYGAFTATLVAAQFPVRLLVLLAGMIPAPGESPGDWWGNTGYQQAVEKQAELDGGQTGNDDPFISFYNGVPRPLAEEALRRGGRGESSVVWNTRWPLDAWPDVPTKFILCKDDQFFPAAFMGRQAHQRLGAVADEVPGCHCAALSHPRELGDLLVSYLA